MKIKENHIALRYIDFFSKGDWYKTRPKSLCSLFWTFVLAIIFLPVLLLGKAIMIAIDSEEYELASCYTGAILYILLGLFVGLITWTLIVNTWLMVIILAGACILFYIGFREDIHGTISNSVLIQGIKSIKSKVCPIIEYEEAKDNSSI